MVWLIIAMHSFHPSFIPRNLQSQQPQNNSLPPNSHPQAQYILVSQPGGGTALIPAQKPNINAQNPTVPQIINNSQVITQIQSNNVTQNGRQVIGQQIIGANGMVSNMITTGNIGGNNQLGNQVVTSNAINNSGNVGFQVQPAAAVQSSPILNSAGNGSNAQLPQHLNIKQENIHMDNPTLIQIQNSRNDNNSINQGALNASTPNQFQIKTEILNPNEENNNQSVSNNGNRPALVNNIQIPGSNHGLNQNCAKYHMVAYHIPPIPYYKQLLSAYGTMGP